MIDKKSICPKNPTKENLLDAIEYYDLKTIQTLYRLLIEFDSNAETSDFEEFINRRLK